MWRRLLTPSDRHIEPFLFVEYYTGQKSIPMNRFQQPSRNRFSYRPTGLHRLAELIPWNRFLGSLKVQKKSCCGGPVRQPYFYLVPIVPVDWSKNSSTDCFLQDHRRLVVSVSKVRIAAWSLGRGYCIFGELVTNLRKQAELCIFSKTERTDLIWEFFK